MSEPHSMAPGSPGQPAQPATTLHPSTPGRQKPAKPYPDFPLFAHAAGVWAKKIRGQLHYFGPWSDPEGALQKYLEQKDALHAGRKPRQDTQGLTIKELANAFLIAKAQTRDVGEITPRSWQDYKDACDLLVSHFGKGRQVADLDPEDFAELRKKMAKGWGPGTLGNVINRMRVAFKFASDNRLIDRPVCYGSSFKRPSRKTLRIDKAKKGPKLFTADDSRRLIDAAGMPLKAMILLGINAGFGNADCGTLPLSAVNLETGWIDFPRPKTGIPRRCHLWPETIQAIRDALAIRPTPKKEEYAGLVFITKYGQPWGKDTTDNPVTKEMKKLLNALGINGRKGLGFYTLRHTFRTVADESKDQPAVDYIMGHEVPHMSSIYRETIADARLRAVAEHVRHWLFPNPKSPPTRDGIIEGAGRPE
ncbi:MAG: tyrosine-type recombinase/integrase [Planctomycetes bacterium]|nr:tyrosine-type recombinase/integrase [Planctomycetota bacterium]